MVRGVQADLMPRLHSLTNRIRTALIDHCSGPQGALQKNIPTVQTDRPRSEHLDQKRWPHQTSEKPTHIVRSDGKKETGPDLALCQKIDQIEHSDTGAPQRIDIYSQAGMAHDASAAHSTADLRK